MTVPATFAVLLAPAAFLLVALVAVARPGRRPHAVRRAGTVASVVGLLVAVGAGVAAAVRGPLASPTLGVAELGVAVRLDALSTVMLGMVALLAAVIVRYSNTYLDGDPRQGVFLGRLAVTIATVEVLVVAGNLALLAVAWIATSVTLHRLLVFHPERRAAVVAARKKFVVARVSDVLLLGAVALLYVRFGTGDLGALFTAVTAAGTPGWALDATGTAALLLALSAAFTSAQFPTHGWLVEVMETPTPVSALLHAGILNAGPFLVLRFVPVVDGAGIATSSLVVAGGLTALVASVVLLTQPAYKVGLGYSSAAHMGFSLLACGLGLYPAAMLHLVAHSFYKAHSFLSSGSVIEQARAARVALPQRLGSPVRVAASLLVALGLYGLVGLTWGGEQLRDPFLLLLGALLVLGLGQLVAPALDSDGPVGGVVRVTGLALAVVTAFFVLESGAHAVLRDVVPGTADRTAVHLGLGLAVLLAFTVVVLLQVLEPVRPASARRRAWAVHLRNGLYANALLDRLVGGLDAAPARPRVVQQPTR